MDRSGHWDRWSLQQEETEAVGRHGESDARGRVEDVRGWRTEDSGRGGGRDGKSWGGRGGVGETQEHSVLGDVSRGPMMTPWTQASTRRSIVMDTPTSQSVLPPETVEFVRKMEADSSRALSVAKEATREAEAAHEGVRRERAIRRQLKSALERLEARLAERDMEVMRYQEEAVERKVEIRQLREDLREVGRERDQWYRKAQDMEQRVLRAEKAAEEAAVAASEAIALATQATRRVQDERESGKMLTVSPMSSSTTLHASQATQTDIIKPRASPRVARTETKLPPSTSTPPTTSSRPAPPSSSSSFSSSSRTKEGPGMMFTSTGAPRPQSSTSTSPSSSYSPSSAPRSTRFIHKRPERKRTVDWGRRGGAGKMDIGGGEGLSKGPGPSIAAPATPPPFPVNDEEGSPPSGATSISPGTKPKHRVHHTLTHTSDGAPSIVPTRLHPKPMESAAWWAGMRAHSIAAVTEATKTPNPFDSEEDEVEEGEMEDGTLKTVHEEPDGGGDGDEDSF